MTKDLLEHLYLKLKSEPDNHRKNKTGCFDFFEEKVLTDQQFHRYKNVSVTAKTMKNYYEKHVEGRQNRSKEPCADLKNLIAEYLGYKDYIDFCSNKTKNSEASSAYASGSFKKKIFYFNLPMLSASL